MQNTPLIFYNFALGGRPERMSSQRSFEKDHSAKSSGAEVGNRDCREISVTCHSTDAGWCPLKSTRSTNLASHGRRAGSEWRCEEEKSSEWFAECLMFGEFPVSWYRAFRPVFSTQRIHCLGTGGKLSRSDSSGESPIEHARPNSLSLNPGPLSGGVTGSFGVPLLTSQRTITISPRNFSTFDIFIL